MKNAISLNFHGIGTPARELEPDEAPYWVSKAQFLKVLDHVAANSNAYVITFDDGNKSDHDIALPALLERGLTARFFVLTGRLGQAGSLNQDDIKALLNAGMTIGSHGINHLPWPTLSDETLEEEVEESRQVLEALCGQPIVEAGIPFGRYDKRVLQALRAAGYQTAWTSDGGRIGSDDFLHARTSLRGDMNDDALSDILNARMPFPRRLRRTIAMARRRHFTTG